MIMYLKVIIVSQYTIALPTIVRAIQENKGEVVAYESELNYVSLNRSIKSHQANLLILTIDEQIQVCKIINKLIKANPNIAFITIARKTQVHIIANMIQIKTVKGILLVNEDADQLIETIRKVRNGQNCYSLKVSQIMATSLTASFSLTRSNLTPREKEVFDLLDQDKDKKQIAQELEISYETVRTHIRNINFKLKS